MKKTGALLLCALLLLSLFAGCSAASDKSSYMNTEETYPSAAEEAQWEYKEEADSGAGWELDTPAEAPMTEDSTAEPMEAAEGGESMPEPDNSVSAGDKIIYSADLYLETTEFDKATRSIEQIVEDCGGYIQTSNTNGTTRYEDDGTTSVVDRYAYYTIAVPQDSFESVLSQSGTVGNVISKNRYAENITSQYTDTASRLESLRVQEERLLAMMEETTEIESLIALEERLSDVTYEIESYQRTLNNWDRRIAYSMLSITVEEVARYTSTAPVTRSFGERISDAFRDGWSGFGAGVQTFAIGIVSALPMLLLLAVLAIAVLLIVRGCVRRKKKKAQSAPENPQE